MLERISKISIPLGGSGFTIEILATVSEEAYSERTTSGSIARKSPPDWGAEKIAPRQHPPHKGLPG